MLIKYMFLLLAVISSVFCADMRAQDTASNHFKYVVLHYDHDNNKVPDYQKFRPNLEDGIKDLLVKNKVPMLKYQKEATEKNLQDCDTLVCTYILTYATGLMLNANITCALSITDCNKKEVYYAKAGKMTGAIAGADSYLKVFAKLISPDIVKRFKF